MNFDYKRDLDLVLSLMPRVREIAMHYYEMQNLEVANKEEAGNSPVTQADIEIDHFLHDQIMVKTPEYGWISEEIEDDGSRLLKERVWIVDPIDGTTGFVHRNGGFAVSVGLVENGVPVLGVVYSPVTDECIYAYQGSGVFRNGEPVKPVYAAELKKSLFLTSVGETYKGLWQKYEGDIQQKTVGSIAQKLAFIAVGDADGMVSLRPKNVWDLAAGHALCLEADLKLTDFNGAEINYRQQETRVDRLIAVREGLYKQTYELFHSK